MRHRIDIAENRLDSLPLQSVSSGNKCYGRDNDLTVHAKRSGSNLERGLGVIGNDAVFSADEFGNSLFEFLDAGSGVCQLATIKDAIDTRLQLLQVTHVWTVDMFHPNKSWCSTTNR
jgi:hypothetical protein